MKLPALTYGACSLDSHYTPKSRISVSIRFRDVFSCLSTLPYLRVDIGLSLTQDVRVCNVVIPLPEILVTPVEAGSSRICHLKYDGCSSAHQLVPSLQALEEVS